jgi:hypothetical protein
MIDIVRETVDNIVGDYEAGNLSFDELVSLILLCGYYEAAGKVMGSLKMLLDQGLTGQEAHASVHQMLHAEAEVMGILPATPGGTNVH